MRISNPITAWHDPLNRQLGIVARIRQIPHLDLAGMMHVVKNVACEILTALVRHPEFKPVTAGKKIQCVDPELEPVSSPLKAYSFAEHGCIGIDEFCARRAVDDDCQTFDGDLLRRLDLEHKIERPAAIRLP